MSNNDNRSVYDRLEKENGVRLHSFVRSLVKAAKEVGKPYLSHALFQALNFHAIACLDIKAGEYRPCEVRAGGLTPPSYYQVPDLMDSFINEVNRSWERLSPTTLAAYVLWRLSYIHPFINGNGRTARAACYFALCLRDRVSLDHTPAIPQLLDTHRDEYINALLKADDLHSQREGSRIMLEPIIVLLEKLIQESTATPKVEQVRASYQYERTSSPSLPHARGSGRTGTLAA